MDASYNQRFQAPGDVDSYESLYASGTRDAAVWDLQRPVVQQLVAQIAAERPDARLLDFACGTGRILSAVEHLVPEADGVDLSATMLQRVARTQPGTRVVVGTLAGEDTPDEVRRDYDVVTAFRFFLNVGEQTRRSILAEVRDRLAARRGWLIVNNHGSAMSIRTLALKVNRDPAAMRNTLGDRHFRSLLSAAGFEVTHDYGFGVAPDKLYRSSRSAAARSLDGWAARRSWTRHVSIDRLYVARCTG